MPSLTPKNTPPQGGATKGSGWGGRSKALAFWIFVILVPIAFLKLSRGIAESTPEISYTIYRAQLADTNIAKVVIQGGAKITGEFREAVKVDQKNVNRFWVTLPMANSPTEVDSLRAMGVD